MKFCPCGSGRPPDACCLPFIGGQSSAPTAETLEPMRCTSFFFDQIAAQQDGDGVVKGVLYLPNPALAARYPEDAALLNDSLKTSTFTPVRIRKKQPCPSSQRALM